MKHAPIVVSLIIGVSLIVCAWLLQSAVVSYGNSLERAAQYKRTVDIPSRITLDVELDPVNFRLSNAGGGQAFRIETEANEGG